MSSAERVGRTGHGQLIGTPLTLALLGAQPGHLAVPLHQRFTLGTLRLELIASGRGPGAAALVVDQAGRKVVYAGAVRTAAAPHIEAGEVRTCEAVVVAAPHAGERSGPTLADVVDQTIAWTQAALAAGHRPVLLVDGVLEGLEVAGCLHAAGIAVAGARPIREAARRAAGMWSQIALPRTLAESATTPAMPRTTTRHDAGSDARSRDAADRARGEDPGSARARERTRRDGDPASTGESAGGRDGDPTSAGPRESTSARRDGDPASTGESSGGRDGDPAIPRTTTPQAGRRDGDPAIPRTTTPQSIALSRTITPQLASLAIAVPGREPRAIVWLDADRTGLARALGERAATTALVSARAAGSELSGALDAAFAWSSAADRAQLLAWIEATSAREVYVTGAGAEAIVQQLGARARVLGPPHQMTLFDEAVS